MSKDICKTCGENKNRPFKPIIIDNNPLSIASYDNEQCKECKRLPTEAINNISFCKNCNCMTKRVCGKCYKEQILKENIKAFLNILVKYETASSQKLIVKIVRDVGELARREKED